MDEKINFREMSPKDSKNLQILADIAVREDYLNGNKWFTAEYQRAASRANGGWSPLFAIFSIACFWSVLGTEMFALSVFWLTIFTLGFAVIWVICERVNQFLLGIIHHRYFPNIAFLSVTTWVLYYVTKFYSAN
jgi:hypothetical protein